MIVVACALIGPGYIFLTQSVIMKIIGIDLAWRPEKNTSALVVGELSHRKLSITRIEKALLGLDNVLAAIDTEERVNGIAVDASLIINNRTGQRECERAISRQYGRYKAACHASNLTLYPDAASVVLATQLAHRGFCHMGVPKTEQWQIECYPHPALIEMFGLNERLAYKKGKVAQKRRGQQMLAGLLHSLARSGRVQLELSAAVDELLSPDLILANRGKRLKQHEDALDALVCVYIAALYADSQPFDIFGDADDGYICVPQGRCI